MVTFWGQEIIIARKNNWSNIDLSNYNAVVLYICPLFIIIMHKFYEFFVQDLLFTSVCYLQLLLGFFMCSTCFWHQHSLFGHQSFSLKLDRDGNYAYWRFWELYYLASQAQQLYCLYQSTDLEDFLHCFHDQISN